MRRSASNRKAVRVAGVVIILLLCFGCANQNQNLKSDSTFEKWGVLAEESKGHSPVATPRQFDLSRVPDPKKDASLLIGEETRKLPQKPISLTMRQADLKAVLRALARAVNINLLVHHTLQGEVSVDFRDVPWDQAFTGLLRTYGLSYRWEGEIIRVMTIDDVEQELRKKMVLRDTQWVEPLMDPMFIKINYADSKKLSETLRDFLTKDKEGNARGSIRVDDHNNALIVSAIRVDLEKILSVISEVDRPTPQILIRANIVETTKSVARDLGVMWGGRYNTGDYTATGGGTKAASGGPISPTAGGPVGIGDAGFVSNFQAANLSSAAAGSLALLFGTIGGNILEIQLQALQKDNKLNILSSPSITTLDNQKAYTENGERVPYTTIETSTAGGTPTQTTKFEDVVLRLEITPHVIDGRYLKMTIFVKKDEVDMTRRSSLGDPYIIKKQTETVLIVEDGETIVISGLTKQTNLKGDAGWPWLKNIPVLGWAFKAEGRSEAMEEVLIFITPHILQIAKANTQTPRAGATN